MKAKMKHASTKGLTIANSGNRSTYSDYSKMQRAKKQMSGGKKKFRI